MNVVMIIPTGIGAEIGGHAGDANPVAKLLAGACDKLIVHPNVVNASDINEMPDNVLYVEGSMLDRFLEGDIELREVKSNRVLVAVNSPVLPETINSVSAARATLGLDAEIVVLNTPLELIATIEQGRASGEVRGWEELVSQVKDMAFDALAIASPITLDPKIALEYLVGNSNVNPWGAVEAMASRLVSESLNKPVAHAPAGETLPGFKQVVDPRMAAEIVSVSYLHCVLKGLHRAPRPRLLIGVGISVYDVDCLVTPIGCVGRPHKACIEHGIPIIAVKENTTCLNDPMPDEFIFVDNYLEAVGLIIAMQAGVHHSSVRRPLNPTIVIKREHNNG